MPEIAAESLQSKRPLDLSSFFFFLDLSSFFSFSWTCSVFFFFLDLFSFFSFSWTSSVFTKGGRQRRSWHVSLYFTSMKPPAAEFSFLICSLQLKSNPWSHFPSTSRLRCLRGRRSWCLGGARCLAGLRLNRGAAVCYYTNSHIPPGLDFSREICHCLCVWAEHH